MGTPSFLKTSITVGTVTLSKTTDLPFDAFNQVILSQGSTRPRLGICIGTEMGIGTDMGTGTLSSDVFAIEFASAENTLFGITSDTPFTSLTFTLASTDTSITEGFTIDSITTSTTLVPDPGTLGLLAIGLLELSISRRPGVA